MLVGHAGVQDKGAGERTWYSAHHCRVVVSVRGCGDLADAVDEHSTDTFEHQRKTILLASNRPAAPETHAGLNSAAHLLLLPVSLHIPRH